MNNIVSSTRSALIAFLACAGLTSCDSTATDQVTWDSCTGEAARCSTPACVPDALEELTPDQARAMGFSIDTALALFGDEQHEVDFHFGNVESCSDEASADGRIRVRVQLERLLLQKQGGVAGGVCESYLVYQGRTEIEADGGLISGTFESNWTAADNRVESSAELDPESFAGSLGLRVDMSRIHEVKVNVALTLRSEGPRGGVHILVRYLDGKEPGYDFGEGLLWPANQAADYCNWLRTEPSDAPLLTLDEYNARR